MKSLPTARKRKEEAMGKKIKFAQSQKKIKFAQFSFSSDWTDLLLLKSF